MKMNRIMAASSLALALACFSTSAQADISPGAPITTDPFTINFDEDGNGLVSVFGGGTYLESGYLAPDQSGNFGLVLTYDLPDIIGGGGINILDSNGNISDNLFFYNDNNGGHMEYFSQLGGGQLADVGVVDFGFTGATENPDGTFQFVAGNGDPSTTNFYNGLSGPAVPEPGSFALLGIGLVGLLGYARRRSK